MSNIDGIQIPQITGGNDASYVQKISDSLSAVDPHDHSLASGLPVRRVHVDAVDDVTITSDNGVLEIKDGSITEDYTEVGVSVPTGSIISFFDKDDNAPDGGSGWLRCNGSAVSRTTYAALFAVIGTKFGSGDGATTFNLPSLAGQFLRGASLSSGRDPDAASRTASASGGATGDNVGTYQKGATKVHTHTITTAHTWRQAGTTPGANYGGSHGHSAISPTYTINNSGGNEFRPKNMYVGWWIKV